MNRALATRTSAQQPLPSARCGRANPGLDTCDVAEDASSAVSEASGMV